MNAKLFIEMERISTTLCQLAPGDRFYFASDRKRITWEVMPYSGPKKTWTHGGQTFSCSLEVKNDAGARKFCLRKTQVIHLKQVI